MIIATDKELKTAREQNQNPGLEHIVTSFMELNIIPEQVIPTIDSTEAYNLWNKSIYIIACAEVFALKLLARYKQLTPSTDSNVNDMQNKLITAIAKKGLNINDLLKALT